MKPALIPQLFFLAGILCFLAGTVISIRQTLAAEPANINCGDAAEPLPHPSNLLSAPWWHKRPRA